MEQVNAKHVILFVVAACLVGMVVGSAVTLAVLNVQRAIPSTGFGLWLSTSEFILMLLAL